MYIYFSKMAKRKRVNITRGHSNLHVQPQAEQQESEFKQHLQFENDQHEEGCLSFSPTLQSQECNWMF